MAGSFVEEVDSGDQLRALKALRGVLAESIAQADDVKAVAPLARQLALVLERIDALDEPEEASAVDDLASRRADRIAKAQGL